MNTHQMAGSPASDDLGPLLHTRERKRAEAIGMAAALVVIGMGALAFAGFVFTKVGQKPQALLAVLVGLGIAVASLGSIRRMFRSVSFYEEGVVDRCLGRRREYRYAGVAVMSYARVRRYARGIYAHTELTLRLVMDDGRVFRLWTRHKEKAKGLVTVLAKNPKFEGEDEIDVVKDIIASRVAERLAAALEKDGELDWTQSLRLTREGVEVRTGARGGEIVRWGDIAGATFENDTMRLFARGEEKCFAATGCAGSNFYPCLQLARGYVKSAGAVRAA